MRIFNRPLRILLFTDALVLLSGAMLIPFYTVYVERIGGDILDAGLAASLFAIAAGFSSLLAGRLSDSLKRRELIIASGYLITAAGFLMYAFVHSVWQLLAVQAIIGLAQASYAPAYDALYSKHLGSKKHPSARWSAWESVNYFSIAIGAFAGALVLHYTDFTVLFTAMAILCAFSGIYVATRPKHLL